MGRFETVTGATAALADLSQRGLVRATGGDRLRFLQAMLANDVAKLAPGQACASLLLDRKGHVLAELWVLLEPDAILLDVVAGREAEVTGVLEKHIIADDVALASLSAEQGQLGFEGPDGAAAARALGAPELEPGRFARTELGGHSLVWLAGGSLGADGVRVLAPRAFLPELRARAGLRELSSEEREVLRIEAGIPAFGAELTERSFPQEAHLEHAFSLSKGCYVGQEIVARIASRGAVNRSLVRLRTRALVAAGAEIRAGDTAVGQVTSSALSPSSGPIALGYVKVAAATAGNAVAIDGVAGEIV